MVALKLTGPALLFAGFGLILWGIFELSDLLFVLGGVVLAVGLLLMFVAFLLR